jgi:hypothetical protein
MLLDARSNAKSDAILRAVLEREIRDGLACLTSAFVGEICGA